MTRRLSFALFVGCALLAGIGTAHAASLNRSRYLQMMSADRVLVAFRLDQTCLASVHLNGGNISDRTFPSGETSSRHAIQLEGLVPNTTYQYVVEACGGLVSSPKAFTTASLPQTRSVHFTAMGDFGIDSDEQREVVSEMLKDAPDLLLTLGDVYDKGSEVELESRFFAPMANLLSSVPVFSTLGNHEYGTNQGQPYIDNMYLPSNNSKNTERYYSFDWGHVHFAALDSSCAVGIGTQCTLAEQRAWLEQDLAKTDAPWKVVYFHHPLWSTGSHGSTVQLRQALAPLLEAAGVDLVLTGHDHNYERTHPLKGADAQPIGTPGAVTYFVVGTGGVALKAFSVSQPYWSAMRDNSINGYLDVKVIGGTLTAQMRTVDGRVLDTYQVTKALPVAVIDEPAPVGLSSPDAEEAEQGNLRKTAGCGVVGAFIPAASFIAPLLLLALRRLR
jgi:acid phosphatase type 7